MDVASFMQEGMTCISNLILNEYKNLHLSEQELVMYLQLCEAQQQGQKMPDLAQISEKMGCSIEEGYQLVNALSQKKIIQLRRAANQEGKQEEYYDLSGFFTQVEYKKKQENLQKNKQYLQALCVEVEQILARSLSPFEIEYLTKWSQRYNQALIQLAFTEAKRKQVKGSFRYVERILQNWEQKEITTVEAAKAQLAQREQKRMYTNKKEVEEIEIPIFDHWDYKGWK